MADKKLLFIINPRSGKGQIKNHLLSVLDIFNKGGYEVTVAVTQERGDAIRIAREREDGYDLIACSGGDGTLDEVVTGLVRSGRPLPIGYIPAGSTNDFAASLKIPRNMEKAAQSIVERNLFSCDIAGFNEGIFVYVAAFGAFTEVSYGTDQSMKNALGHMAYILEGMRSIGNIKAYPMRITWKDTVYEGEYLYGMITNSKSVGGFRRLTGKNVELNDGELEVTLVRKPPSLTELNQVILSLNEKRLDGEFITCFKTDKLLVESGEEIAWTVDGEFGGLHSKVAITDYKEAVEIIVPAN